jgi:outer membrane biosynthesis protein TonB
MVPENANSNDPLVIAQQDINKLEEDVKNLIDQAKTKELIAVAKTKYTTAVEAKNAFQVSQGIYNDAVDTYDSAILVKQEAQLAVDTQQPIRDSAYATLQNKQNALDIANINLAIAQSNGQPATNSLSAFLYNCWSPYNIYNNMPPLGCGTEPVSMGPWSNINFNFGSGGPAGLYDDYQIRWSGYIKSTQHWTPQFRTCGDDGMILIINGTIVRNDWYDRGGGCASSTGYYMESNGWLPIEVWWYENGGGANGQLQWDIGNGFTAIPSSVFSMSIPLEDPNLPAAIEAQNIAQQEYNQALETYNIENNKLIEYNQTLQTSQENLTLASENLTTTTQNLTIALGNYEIAISEMQIAIINAQTEYNNQLDFENKQRVAAAIAQALANQPQPEPTPELSPQPEPSQEPSSETTPSPEPSPEQTKPNDPNPEPSSDTTDEPKPTPSPEPEQTPEPSPEPSPQPTDINPDPTSEPEPIPVEPFEEPSLNNDITEDLLRKLSDLTSKDTLTKLTDEQKEAVAGTLGIKTEEIALIAELAKDNPAVADALESFADKLLENKNAPMPYTIADAITEVQAEAFLSDPIGAFTNIDLEKVLSPSEWGKDMTDDQRKKVQEIVIPVIIASNIVAASMTRRK